MGRGPSYPFIDLEEAIAATQKIYAYTKRSWAPSDAVVEHALKYSLKSSGGIKTVAALKAYGLIEEGENEKSRAIKITDRAYRILVDDQSSPERIQAIKDAALSPKWYQYCWQKWGDTRPPAMRSVLLINHGFIPTTVDSFLKDYEKTLKFAGISAGDGIPEGIRQDGSKSESHIFNIGDYVQWESQGVLWMPEAKRISAFLDDGKFATVEGSTNPVPVAQLIPAEPPATVKPANALTPVTTGIVAPPRGGVKVHTETFALSEGVTGQLQWPSVMSREAYEDFEYQIEGLKKRINRAVAREAPPAIPVASENEGK
jgi:hypothetical protein